MSKTSIFHLKVHLAYDQTQLQRGLKVYRGLFIKKHGQSTYHLEHLLIKTALAIPKIIRHIEYYEIFDPELDDYRAAVPADHFPAVVDAGAPDLSLMAKARAGFHGRTAREYQLVNGMGVLNILPRY